MPAIKRGTIVPRLPARNYARRDRTSRAELMTAVFYPAAAENISILPTLHLEFQRRCNAFMRPFLKLAISRRSFFRLINSARSLQARSSAGADKIDRGRRYAGHIRADRGTVLGATTLRIAICPRINAGIIRLVNTRRHFMHTCSQRGRSSGWSRGEGK